MHCHYSRSLFGHVPSLKTFADNTCMLKVGNRYNYQDLVKQLTEHLNYDVEAACENAGEIAIRGGIIDIYPANEQQPYRIDFFGDEIESIRIFDPMSQRSIKNQNTLFIPPNFIESGYKLHDLMISYQKNRYIGYLIIQV